MNAVRPFSPPKDFPKVEGKPLPADVMVWTAYLTPDGRMRARLHPANNPNMFIYDGEIFNPENLAQMVETWRKK